MYLGCHETIWRIFTISGQSSHASARYKIKIITSFGVEERHLLCFHVIRSNPDQKSEKMRFHSVFLIYAWLPERNDFQLLKTWCHRQSFCTVCWLKQVFLRYFWMWHTCRISSNNVKVRSCTHPRFRVPLDLNKNVTVTNPAWIPVITLNNIAIPQLDLHTSLGTGRLPTQLNQGQELFPRELLGVVASSHLKEHHHPWSNPQVDATRAQDSWSYGSTVDVDNHPLAMHAHYEWDYEAWHC